MDIIRFPTSDSTQRATVQTQASQRMVLGPMNFTCTSCGQTCAADFKSMIFRSVEFHCTGCGTFFKISNPAFPAAPKPAVKK